MEIFQLFAGLLGERQLGPVSWFATGQVLGMSATALLPVTVMGLPCGFKFEETIGDSHAIQSGHKKSLEGPGIKFDVQVTCKELLLDLVFFQSTSRHLLTILNLTFSGGHMW